jgi:ferredoxin-NADP reductase
MTASGFNSVISTSYTAEDSDIVAVESAYTGLETALKNRIANIQNEYPGYDEYRFDLAAIEHDTFELASYLTAKFNSYTLGMVQGELQNLFNQQYILTFYPVTEIRYRTETRTGSYTEVDLYTGRRYTRYYTYTVEVPYNYYILNVSLVNNTIGSIAAANLMPEQLEMYAIYLETKGNKPDVFAEN